MAGNDRFHGIDRLVPLREWPRRFGANRKSDARAPVAPGIEQRARREFGISRGAKPTTFQTVERSLGGEEAEPALVAGDDACGAIIDFDNVGLGHGCAFAGMPALLSDGAARLVTKRSATGPGHRNEAAFGNAFARMTVHLLVRSHAIDLW